MTLWTPEVSMSWGVAKYTGWMISIGRSLRQGANKRGRAGFGQLELIRV